MKILVKHRMAIACAAAVLLALLLERDGDKLGEQMQSWNEPVGETVAERVGREAKEAAAHRAQLQIDETKFRDRLKRDEKEAELDAKLKASMTIEERERYDRQKVADDVREIRELLQGKR
jgi:hypothetical protein